MAVGAADRGGQGGDLRQRAPRREPRERPGARDPELELARGAPQLAAEQAAATAPHLPQRAAGVEARLDRDAQQIEHVGDLAGEHRRPLPRPPGQHHVRREEPRPRRGQQHDRREAAGRRGRERQREEHARDGAAGLHGEDVGDADARRRTGRREPRSDVAGLQPHAGAAADGAEQARERLASASASGARTTQRRGQLGERDGEQATGERREDDGHVRTLPSRRTITSAAICSTAASAASTAGIGALTSVSR